MWRCSAEKGPECSAAGWGGILTPPSHHIPLGRGGEPGEAEPTGEQPLAHFWSVCWIISLLTEQWSVKAPAASFPACTATVLLGFAVDGLPPMSSDRDTQQQPFSPATPELRHCWPEHAHIYDGHCRFMCSFLVLFGFICGKCSFLWESSPVLMEI